MRYPSPLIPAVLVRRYKRFLADVILQDGTETTVHCANSGAMTHLAEPGSRIWLSLAPPNRKRRHPYTWELTEIEGKLVMVHPRRCNDLLEEAIRLGQIPELDGYNTIRREVRLGQSRIDILLEQGQNENPDGEKSGRSRTRCFVEVKSATLAQGPTALFPDAVTTRGTRHLKELEEAVAAGNRGVVFFVAGHSDCTVFSPADDIDRVYGETLRQAVASGVEAIAYRVRCNEQEIVIDRKLLVVL